jgi:Ca2+-binding RTX toxin-like protein
MSKRIDTLTPSQNASDAALMLDLGLGTQPSAAPATNVTPDSPLPLTSTVDAATTIQGTDGNNDPLTGTLGDDIIYGLGGIDRIFGLTGNDDYARWRGRRRQHIRRLWQRRNRGPQQ